MFILSSEEGRLWRPSEPHPGRLSFPWDWALGSTAWLSLCQWNTFRGTPCTGQPQNSGSLVIAMVTVIVGHVAWLLLSQYILVFKSSWTYTYAGKCVSNTDMQNLPSQACWEWKTLEKTQNKKQWVVAGHCLNLSTWEAESGESLSSRPAWSLEQVPGQPQPRREILSHKTKRIKWTGMKSKSTCVLILRFTHGSNAEGSF